VSVNARLSLMTARRAGLIRDALDMAGFQSAGSGDLATLVAVQATAPRAMAGLLRSRLHLPFDGVVVAGPLDKRLLFLKEPAGTWILLSLSDSPLSDVRWPPKLADQLTIADPDRRLSRLQLTANGLHRLTRPRIALVALYHREVFPLPRFPLGISDLARSIRAGLEGDVYLIDMQLTPDLDSVVNAVTEYSPDILGISATFGQYDVLTSILSRLEAHALEPPLVVFGGSLSALNQEMLLERYPESLVAHGPGELPMRDLVAYWHGDVGLDRVRGVSYRSGLSTVVTSRIDNRAYEDILPELDLLRPTLEHHGVMQLESSRGCTHACSFCPRKHKGVWSGDDPASLDSILPDLADIYAAHPHIARKLYLVDEEFIGHDLGGPESARAEAVARRLYRAAFRWETSARVDQVYRPDRGRDWHVRRIELWKTLLEHGLDRCLFGVESGVDSILRRFNKHTTVLQNGMAIRILTACGIPIRCTYITFDHLMNADELLESQRFQGRTDLLMQPMPHMRADDLFDALHDETFVRRHTTGQPFYVSISYMLVSMECLLKSPYLKLVESEGLADDVLPSMGRRNARFRDPRIGLLSQWAQRWVDRNFSFDYTLKSLEKITEGDERAGVRRLRVLVKRSAYDLLRTMVALTREDLGARPVDRALRRDVDTHFQQLSSTIERELPDVLDHLREERRQILSSEYRRWSTRRSWDLINAPDHCV
jgi:radical SAM superfamily enzyme YgiQ (UPF0313 family)